MTKDIGKKKENIKPARSKPHVASLSEVFGSSLALKGLATILILGFIIYANSFESTFHLDDINNIRDNASSLNKPLPYNAANPLRAGKDNKPWFIGLHK